jgi:hypothetical protein
MFALFVSSILDDVRSNELAPQVRSKVEITDTINWILYCNNDKRSGHCYLSTQSKYSSIKYEPYLTLVIDKRFLIWLLTRLNVGYAIISPSLWPYLADVRDYVLHVL